MEINNPLFRPYSICLAQHNGKTVIAFHFSKDATLLAFLKSQLTIRWSQTLKAWYAIDMPQYRRLIGIPMPMYKHNKLALLSDNNQKAYDNMQQQLILKGYSANTQTTYLMEFMQLLLLLKQHDVQTLSPSRIKAYILYCHKKLKLSDTSIHSRMNAIKFYFEQVLHQDKLFFDIPRPKKASTLPKVISQRDIKRLFEVIQNPKHKIALQLVYGMGLRVSEIVGIQISDIDSGRMQVHIRAAKGKKDRYVNLPESILEDLRNYYLAYKPQTYLLEGLPGQPYGIRSVQQIFRTAMTKAKINKKVGIHGLRHSYATHLLEAGTDISLIKELLGHNDIKTTLIYAKVGEKLISKVQSPLDTL